MADSLEALRADGFDLVLVNRKLDRDYSDGIEVIRAIKADSQLAHLPAMLVTNYPEHQDAAVAIGAERGFGKLEYRKPSNTGTAREVPGGGRGGEVGGKNSRDPTDRRGRRDRLRSATQLTTGQPRQSSMASLTG